MITNTISWYFLDFDSKKNGFYQYNQTNHNKKMYGKIYRNRLIMFYIEQAPRLSTASKNV